jgi:hypothetical protein
LPKRAESLRKVDCVSSLNHCPTGPMMVSMSVSSMRAKASARGLRISSRPPPKARWAARRSSRSPERTSPASCTRDRGRDPRLPRRPRGEFPSQQGYLRGHRRRREGRDSPGASQGGPPWRSRRRPPSPRSALRGRGQGRGACASRPEFRLKTRHRTAPRRAPMRGSAWGFA